MSEHDTLPAPVVPYPKGCFCPDPAPAECREMAIIYARKLGQPAAASGECDCACHTMRPSPWDWRGGEDDE